MTFMYELKKNIVQISYKKQYDLMLKNLGVTSGKQILDIGSGIGFLKPMVNAKHASYIGIEPDRASFDAACQLYGSECFISGFFPEAAPQKIYDIVLALSCVDEVPNKIKFLEEVLLLIKKSEGIAYIAVRNGDFFINRFKTKKMMEGRSERAIIGSQDLTFDEWKSLFVTIGFDIYDYGKFWRPWLIGFTFIGVKNIFYKIISMLVSTKYSYMLYFKIKAK
jgi:SAM-dependent methyltransferase